MLRTDLIGKIVDYDMIVVESFKDVGDFGHNIEIDVTINPGRYKQTGRLVGIELDHGKLYYLIENTHDEGLAAVLVDEEDADGSPKFKPFYYANIRPSTNENYPIDPLMLPKEWSDHYVSLIGRSDIVVPATCMIEKDNYKRTGELRHCSIEGYFYDGMELNPYKPVIIIRDAEGRTGLIYDLSKIKIIREKEEIVNLYDTVITQKLCYED